MYNNKPIGFAITGASGIIYGLRTIEEILKSGYDIYLTVSDTGKIVLKQELNIDITDNPSTFFKNYFKSNNISYYSPDDFFSPLASGSSHIEAMLIIPCSMKTVAAIASGNTQNLIERASDVSLKEGRKLILVPRETPLNQTHLANLLKLAQMGVHIVPAMPGFYNHPQKIEDLVNFIVARILNLLKIEHNLVIPWGK
ncbi:UbiX family flavin prenyltransferase [Candidatus Desantisbacteria bacterium]|nr:UbiX family flavin prenyltransferase [Candidatus Desantisbacteria bacterium]